MVCVLVFMPAEINLEICFVSALMDSFKVEIDVQSYLTIVDGRRVYRRGKTWDFAVGRDLSVAQIRGAVEEQFEWSTDQRMTIWYGSGDDTVPLISESEIGQLFDICNDSRIVQFGVTIESKSNEDAHVNGDEENDQPVHAPFFAWPNQAYAGEYEDDEPAGNMRRWRKRAAKSRKKTSMPTEMQLLLQNGTFLYIY